MQFLTGSKREGEFRISGEISDVTRSIIASTAYFGHSCYLAKLGELQITTNPAYYYGGGELIDLKITEDRERSLILDYVGHGTRVLFFNLSYASRTVNELLKKTTDKKFVKQVDWVEIDSLIDQAIKENSATSN